jgi:plasmid stabilization system protein ParE
MPVKLEDIAVQLASGYPSEDASAVAAEFVEALRIVLPALAEKAESARHRVGGSVEEVWEAIRGDAEASFQAALNRVARVKVLYVASKFMNNRAVGTMITQAALALAAGEEV